MAANWALGKIQHRVSCWEKEEEEENVSFFSSCHWAVCVCVRVFFFFIFLFRASPSMPAQTSCHHQPDWTIKTEFISSRHFFWKYLRSFFGPVTRSLAKPSLVTVGPLKKKRENTLTQKSSTSSTFSRKRAFLFDCCCCNLLKYSFPEANFLFLNCAPLFFLMVWSPDVHFFVLPSVELSFSFWDHLFG